MEINPQVVFERMFGDGSTAEERFRRRTQQRSILDSITESLLTLLRLLLEHGADPALATTNGTTPLMVASGIGWVEGVTYEWSREDTLATVRLLLELGADVDAADGDGRTALHGAAHKGRNDVVRMLVDHGADLAARDDGSRDSIQALAGVT